jgi:hypothetical protein
MTNLFCYIPLSLVADDNLSPAEFRCLFILLSFDLPDKDTYLKKGVVWIGTVKLSNLLGMSLRQTIRILNSLNNKKYIRRFTKKNEKTKTIIAASTLAHFNNGDTDVTYYNHHRVNLRLDSPNNGDTHVTCDVHVTSDKNVTYPENVVPLVQCQRGQSSKHVTPMSGVTKMSPEYIRKEKNKNTKKTKTKKSPYRDPDKFILDAKAIDLQPYRETYGPKGVYVEDILGLLIMHATLDEAAKTHVSSKDYYSIPLTLHTYCRNDIRFHGERPNPYLVDKPSPGPSPEDRQAEQEKAEYNRTRDLIANLDEHERRALTDYAKDLLKKDNPTLKPSDLGYDIQLKISETDAYKRIYE